MNISGIGFNMKNNIHGMLSGKSLRLLHSIQNEAHFTFRQFHRRNRDVNVIDQLVTHIVHRKSFFYDNLQCSFILILRHQFSADKHPVVFTDIIPTAFPRIRREEYGNFSMEIL